jgi:Rrf2 family protein
MALSVENQIGSNHGIVTPDIKLVGLSSPLRHALQALAIFAARPGKPMELSGIARRFGLPEAALAKSFQNLVRGGVLTSRRGPNGGYRLERQAREVSLAEVIAALGGTDRRHGRCLLEERACSPGGACVLHAAAVEANERMLASLRTLTLADLKMPRRARRPSKAGPHAGQSD